MEGGSKGPKYVFTGKNVVEKTSEGPGPGQYQPSLNAQTTEITPYWSFGRDNRTYYRTDKDLPGPGNYEVRKGFLGKGPVFGHEKRGKTEQSTSPGPGAYHVGAGSDRKGGFSMSSRHPFRTSWEGSPGPGAYNLSKQVGADKGFPLSRAARAHLASSVGASTIPGPGAYNPGLKETVSVPGIRSGTRVPIATDTGVPGPGSYSVSLKTNAPQYGMKGRHQAGEPSTGEGPGPGQYSPEATARGKETAPNWSFGREGKNGGGEEKRKKEMPGPGMYQVKSPPPLPRWTFGNEKRGKTDRNDSPGPGSYDVKPTIPAVPSYLLTS